MARGKLDDGKQVRPQQRISTGQRQQRHLHGGYLLNQMKRFRG
jgi:hypothetical protein